MAGYHFLKKFLFSFGAVVNCSFVTGLDSCCTCFIVPFFAISVSDPFK